MSAVLLLSLLLRKILATFLSIFIVSMSLVPIYLSFRKRKIDYTTSSVITDFALVVEGQKIYVGRQANYHFEIMPLLNWSI